MTLNLGPTELYVAAVAWGVFFAYLTAVVEAKRTKRRAEEVRPSE